MGHHFSADHLQVRPVSLYMRRGFDATLLLVIVLMPQSQLRTAKAAGSCCVDADIVASHLVWQLRHVCNVHVVTHKAQQQHHQTPCCKREPWRCMADGPPRVLLDVASPSCLDRPICCVRKPEHQRAVERPFVDAMVLDDLDMAKLHDGIPNQHTQASCHHDAACDSVHTRPALAHAVVQLKGQQPSPQASCDAMDELYGGPGCKLDDGLRVCCNEVRRAGLVARQPADQVRGWKYKGPERKEYRQKTQCPICGWA